MLIWDEGTVATTLVGADGTVAAGVLGAAEVTVIDVAEVVLVEKFESPAYVAVIECLRPRREVAAQVRLPPRWSETAAAERRGAVVEGHALRRRGPLPGEVLDT